MNKIELIDLVSFGDDRGELIVCEQGQNVPFDLKRVYYIFGLDKNIPRGFHAHKRLRQLAICLKGSCTFLLDDGCEKYELTLTSPKKGLLMESMLWHEMRDFTEDCVLLVLADNYYDESDYIRDYELFLKAVKEA